MIALYDFIPKFCPNCGLPTMLRSDPVNMAEFSSNLCFLCSFCGLTYQRAESNTMYQAATKSGGDLAKVSFVKEGKH
jgi:hypothetical protein